MDRRPLSCSRRAGSADRGEPGSLNHLGVEMFLTTEVTTAHTRIVEAGLTGTAESGTCCYAEQEKVWVDAPDQVPWELYTVIAGAEPEVASDGLC